MIELVLKNISALSRLEITQMPEDPNLLRKLQMRHDMVGGHIFSTKLQQPGHFSSKTEKIAQKSEIFSNTKHINNSRVLRLVPEQQNGDVGDTVVRRDKMVPYSDQLSPFIKR